MEKLQSEISLKSKNLNSGFSAKFRLGSFDQIYCSHINLGVYILKKNLKEKKSIVFSATGRKKLIFVRSGTTTKIRFINC